MRQIIFTSALVVAATTMLSACGTKGPLTLPPKPSATQGASFAQTAVVDANTGTGQR